MSSRWQGVKAIMAAAMLLRGRLAANGARFDSRAVDNATRAGGDKMASNKIGQ